jgi:hypothetical protein
MSEKTKKLKHYSVKLGCDPEFFLSYKDKIIESTKFIGKDGLIIDGHASSYGTVTNDGVQIEFNPEPAYCRESLSVEIARAFYRINESILMKNKDVKLDFTGVVEFTTEDIKKLSDTARQLGCAPSLNVDPALSGKIKIDTKDYKYRSAGGHIHMGIPSGDGFKEHMQLSPEETVSILDIVVGNTGVLLDRDPMQAKRREVYGKAGEYRLPPHGLEYRVLSNFWLRSYPLTSFALGLARFGMMISYNIFLNETGYYDRNNYHRVLAQCEKGESYFRNILELVDRKDIVQAINTNDFDLAYENFNKVKSFMSRIVPANCYYNYPFCPSRLKYFEFMVDKGIDYFFPEDPLSHWINISNKGLNGGWEHFCSYKLSAAYKKEHTYKEAGVTITPS